MLPSKVDSELNTELTGRVIVLFLCSHDIKNKSFHHRDKYTGNSQPGGLLLAVLLSGHPFSLLVFVWEWFLECFTLPDRTVG